MPRWKTKGEFSSEPIFMENVWVFSAFGKDKRHEICLLIALEIPLLGLFIGFLERFLALSCQFVKGVFIGSKKLVLSLVT